MTDTPTTEDLRAFVGPNADYYLTVWEPALNGTGRATGGNRWAFFFTLYWLSLRGLSGTALVLAALFAVEQFVEGVLIAVAPDESGWIGLLTVGTVLTASLVCAVKGNAWYLQFAREEIAHIRTRNLPEREHLAALTERGGMRVGEMVFVLVGTTILFVVTDATAKTVAGWW